MPLNPAELFVARHCEGSFLSLWGMANPNGKHAGKELCDYIVVCDPDIIIVSVKEIGLASEPTKAEAERWRRKAIEESVKQVYGAERFIAGRKVISSPSGRSVAFGSCGKAGLQQGDFGKGFVHVFDEASLPIILRELDTIADLTEYLEAKRMFFVSGRRIVVPGEEHLLALYLHHNRGFPDGNEVLILDDTLWPGFSASAENQARKTADRASYAWDRVIEYVSRDLLAEDLLFADPPSEAERVLRTLARECRFYRRFLGENLTEMLLGGQVRSRMLQSMSGVTYVMLAADRKQDREWRIAELAARCTIARARIPESSTVVGIASERAVEGARGLSFDLFMMEKPELSADDIMEAERLSNELGYFRSPQVSTRDVQEYPLQANGTP
jgi:hypothetical protein